MPIQISDLPEYAERMTSYQNELRTAENSGDPMAVERAKIGWQKTTLDLREKAMALDQHESRIAIANDRISRDYANVPKEVYDHIVDPEQRVAAAQKVHASLIGIMQNQQGGQWSAGGTGGALAAAPTAKTVDAWTDELAPSVLRGLPGRPDNQRLRSIIFQGQIGSRFSKEES